MLSIAKCTVQWAKHGFARSLAQFSRPGQNILLLIAAVQYGQDQDRGAEVIAQDDLRIPHNTTAVITAAATTTTQHLQPAKYDQFKQKQDWPIQSSETGFCQIFNKSRTTGVGAGKFLGVRRIFARFPKLAQKFWGEFLCEHFLKQTFFWDDLQEKEKVFMRSCNRWLSAIFAQISTKPKLLGMRLPPTSLPRTTCVQRQRLV